MQIWANSSHYISHLLCEYFEGRNQIFMSAYREICAEHTSYIREQSPFVLDDDRMRFVEHIY